MVMEPKILVNWVFWRWYRWWWRQEVFVLFCELPWESYCLISPWMGQDSKALICCKTRSACSSNGKKAFRTQEFSLIQPLLLPLPIFCWVIVVLLQCVSDIVPLPGKPPLLLPEASYRFLPQKVFLLPWIHMASPVSAFLPNSMTTLFR